MDADFEGALRLLCEMDEFREQWRKSQEVCKRLAAFALRDGVDVDGFLRECRDDGFECDEADVHKALGELMRAAGSK